MLFVPRQRAPEGLKMNKYTFEDLVGDEKVFFAEYFNKKPMLRKESMPGDVRDILSIRKLDELLHLEVVRPPYIKVNHNGSGVPEKGYTRSVVVQGVNITDTVVPEKIYELFRAGATVTWCSLNQIVPELRDFTRVISDKMAVRTDVVGFMTPTGKRGYLPHHDPVDLFIVQLEGTKRWKLWNPPAERLGDNASYTDEQLGDPVIEVLLEPGDVLYLPYNTPHAAAAEDQVSLHLSIMMRPRMWKDLLRETFEQVADAPEFNEYPHIGTLRNSTVESLFRQKVTSLAARMDALDAGSELDRLAELGRHMPGSSRGSTFQTIAETDGLTPDALLRRTGASVEFGANDGGRTEMTVNGHRIAVPAQVAERLASLDEGEPIPAGEVFPGVPAERSTKAAQGLTRLGVLEMAGAR
ncbi:cupin domain-containing protein [Streptomyces jumonjinensis]|uniref:cupin domain-containing protein n=1 Tax=Streptomyces jumonjinensis TaxID=1945 RepID=UPI0037B158D2